MSVSQGNGHAMIPNSVVCGSMGNSNIVGCVSRHPVNCERSKAPGLGFNVGLSTD